MTRAVLATFAFALILGACFVSRPSEDLSCTTTTQCMDGRQCIGGYCVVPNCPSDCTACDEVAKTCMVECTSGDNCGNVSCPSGWTCTISCSGGGACDNISCASGSHCAITCTGNNACNDVSCKDACSCDLTCASGACDTVTCPFASGGTKCTTDGMTGSPCDSAPAGCTKC